MMEDNEAAWGKAKLANEERGWGECEEVAGSDSDKARKTKRKSS